MKTSSLFRRVLYFGCTRPELFYFFTGRNCNGLNGPFPNVVQA